MHALKKISDIKSVRHAFYLSAALILAGCGSTIQLNQGGATTADGQDHTTNLFRQRQGNAGLGTTADCLAQTDREGNLVINPKTNMLVLAGCFGTEGPVAGGVQTGLELGQLGTGVAGVVEQNIYNGLVRKGLNQSSSSSGGGAASAVNLTVEQQVSAAGSQVGGRQSTAPQQPGSPGSNTSNNFAQFNGVSGSVVGVGQSATFGGPGGVR